MPPEWEIWLDTHISPAVAKWMAQYTGLAVKSSYTLSLQNLPDLEIYKKAKKHGKVILISKDTDFPELINRLGSPPKLIAVKIGNCRSKELWEYLRPIIVDAVDILDSTEVAIIELE